MTAPVLTSALSPESETFRANAAHNRALVERLRADVARAALGGNEKSRERHTARGKLLPRDRVERLLDPGSPFLEIGQLAANGLYDDEVPGAGMIAGIGRVSGRQCMIVCNDATVKGGTYYPLTVKKHLRAQEIAEANHLPCIYLVDSGGANLPHQAEVFPDRDHFGRIFFNQANMSAKGIPQIACVMGAAAGGAYVPAMSDETVIVRNRHDLPCRSAAGKGRDGRGDQRGRPGRRRSACAQAAWSTIWPRTTSMRHHRARHRQPSGREPGRGKGERRMPAPQIRCRGPLCADPRRCPRALRRARGIARLVDGSEFHEFKQHYGSTLVCGFAHIWGMPVAILANNGVLFPKARRGAHFIELACQRRILLFLQNIRASWWAASTRPKALPSMAPSWSPRSPPPACPRSPWLSAAASGREYGMCGRAYSRVSCYLAQRADR